MRKEFGRDQPECATDHRTDKHGWRKNTAPEPGTDTNCRGGGLCCDQGDQQGEAVLALQRQVGRFVSDTKDLRKGQGNNSDA